jgi:predicted short-subunit dehydrogenase-like oxidoreductase (DUF2520 family)
MKSNAGETSFRISFIGAGRVATTLAEAWQAAGEIVVGASSRTLASAEALARCCPGARAFESAAELVVQSDLVFLSVPDSMIERVVNELPWRSAQYVVHCSAACEVDLLRSAQSLGAQIGGFHPLQIFSDPSVSRHHLAGSSVAIEASGQLEAQLIRLANVLDMKPLRLKPGARLSYHLAGNFAASALLALLAEAENLWEDAGLNRADALGALLPLSLGTLDSARKLGLAKAVSGPVSRGDTTMLLRHLELAKQRSDGDALYREVLTRLVTLSQSSQRLTEAQIDALRAVLVEPGWSPET